MIIDKRYNLNMPIREYISLISTLGLGDEIIRIYYHDSPLNDEEILSYTFRYLPFHQFRIIKKAIVVNLKGIQLVYDIRVAKLLDRLFSIKAFW